MVSKGLKTNKRKMTRLLKSLFALCCMLCAIFAGCESESVETIHPRQERITLRADSFTSDPEVQQKILWWKESLNAEKIKPVDLTNANWDKKDSLTTLKTFEKLKTAKDDLVTLEYESKTPTVLKEAPPAATIPKIHPIGEILAASDSIITHAEQSSSGPAIKMPVLDKPGMADELISVNFDQVDIRIMLKTIGDITGINFVVDDSVKGTVTVMSPTKIRLGDIHKVLESVLEVEGYAAVPAGDLVKIVPKAKAIKHNLQVSIGSDPLEIAQSDSIITQILPLKYADVTEVSRIIRPLLATDSHLAIYPRTNSILITDTSSNIHHIAKIIQTLDVAGSKEQVNVIRLDYASAQILSEQITRIMEKSKVSSPQNGSNRSTPQIKTGMKILPDVRTNSLIVVANAQDTDAIVRLVKQLDVERPIGANNVHVTYLKNATAKETAESLNGALTNLRIAGALEATQSINVTADEGTNALIITASAQDYEVIAGIIEKLDIVREQVLVEMLIMEISQEGLTEIGIDWATLNEAVSGSVRFFGATNFGPRVDFASGNLEGLTIGAWKKTGSTTSIGSLLTALEKQTGVNILSTPHIVTSNHNKAKIIVGENIPYVVESRITETTDFITPTVIDTFEYKDVGISLEITPHISQGGLVRLEIDSKFTKLIQGVTGTSVNTPTTATRQAQTVVSMNSGSTVVIGGLIRDDKTTVEKKIPLLGDLPLIGGLFRYHKDQIQKTNLLIFITPYVMTGQQDLDDMTEKKKEEMKPEIEKLQKNTTSKMNSAGFNSTEETNR